MIKLKFREEQKKMEKDALEGKLIAKKKKENPMHSFM
jgi:hypothetical protein